MDAGGAGGAGGGVSGQGAPSARSARQALLLAVQACGVNEAAVCEASDECRAMEWEIKWAIAACSPEDDDQLLDESFIEEALRRMAKQARFYRARATELATGGSGSGSRGMDVSGGVDGPDAASAERARQALLLVTQFAGVNAIPMRKARAMRDAKKLDLVRVLDDVLEEWEWDDIYGPEWGVDWMLERAAHYGIASALRHALFRGANVHRTRYCHSADCLRLVLEAGGDADNVDIEGNTHLHRIVGDSADCVRLLLEAGADKNKANGRGETPVHIMAEGDSPNCLRLLLEAGADASTFDQYGQTPLHIVAERDSPNCLRLLLEAGADTSARDKDGNTPVHITAMRDSTDCLRLLLEAGADASARGEYGRTPLHTTMWSDSPNCLRLLLEAGADASARDKDGHTPLYYAERGNYKDAAAMLRQHAASGSP